MDDKATPRHRQAKSNLRGLTPGDHATPTPEIDSEDRSVFMPGPAGDEATVVGAAASPAGSDELGQLKPVDESLRGYG